MAVANVAFFDLNGTLVMPVVVDRLEDLQPIPGAPAAVAHLCARGFRCPVVTIQSRIAKGVFTEPQFLAWFHAFADGFKKQGAVLEGPYVCPHRFATPCPCKKPSTLLYERAASECGLQLAGAFVVGDSAADMEAAERIGGVGCLVRTGWGTDEAELARARSYTTYVGQSLAEVVDWILARSAA
jgi:D-glycero-D-manno-heptose 1,7-bisphosphate phosphatase